MSYQPTGRELADAGMATAAAHADAVTGGQWSELAWDFLLAFTKTHSTFMAEDVRSAAALTGAVPAPPDQRAWGAIIQKAARANLIERIGYAPMKSPNCHANPKSVWRVK